MTFLPTSLLASPDQKTADEHEQAAEELLGAAATHLHGGQSRRRTARAAVLTEMAKAHALLASTKRRIALTPARYGGGTLSAPKRGRGGRPEQASDTDVSAS